MSHWVLCQPWEQCLHSSSPQSGAKLSISLYCCQTEIHCWRYGQQPSTSTAFFKRRTKFLTSEARRCKCSLLAAISSHERLRLGVSFGASKLIRSTRETDNCASRSARYSPLLLKLDKNGVYKQAIVRSRNALWKEKSCRTLAPGIL